MRLVKVFAALAAVPLAAFPAGASTFTAGEFVTYEQLLYGTLRGEPEDPQVDTLLENNFDTVFAPFGDLLQVGIPGPAGFSMIFDNADSVIGYLPAGGDPGPLTADLLDPVTSASGVLGGEVLTATLNVTLSNAGLLAHPPGAAFGDLLFQNLDTLIGQTFFAGEMPLGPEIAELDGVPVHEVLSEANLLLGGAVSPFTPIELEAALFIANNAFNDGFVTPYSAYLTPPPSPPAVPEPPSWATLMIGFGGLGIAAAARYRSGMPAWRRPAR